MKIRNHDLSPNDFELCRIYINQLSKKGLSAQEPWELQLENWAINPDRPPSKSTVTRLRLRFPFSSSNDL